MCACKAWILEVPPVCHPATRRLLLSSRCSMLFVCFPQSAHEWAQQRESTRPREQSLCERSQFALWLQCFLCKGFLESLRAAMNPGSRAAPFCCSWLRFHAQCSSLWSNQPLQSFTTFSTLCSWKSGAKRLELASTISSGCSLSSFWLCQSLL